jgi:hypothetical protein
MGPLFVAMTSGEYVAEDAVRNLYISRGLVIPAVTCLAGDCPGKGYKLSCAALR